MRTVKEKCQHCFHHSFSTHDHMGGCTRFEHCCHCGAENKTYTEPTQGMWYTEVEEGHGPYRPERRVVFSN